MKLVAVYNARCGHVAGVVNDRRTAEAQMAAFGLGHAWRLRSATEADIKAVAEAARCKICAFDEVPR